MMQDFHITLNVGVRATSREDAIEIAEELEKCLKANSPYTIRYVEHDDVEED